MTFDTKLFQELSSHVENYESKEIGECGNIAKRNKIDADVAIIEATGLLVTLSHAIKTEMKMSGIISVFYKKVMSELQFYKNTLKHVVLVFDKFTPPIKDPARQKRSAEAMRRTEKPGQEYAKSLSSEFVKATWKPYQPAQTDVGEPQLAHVLLTHYNAERKEIKTEKVYQFTISQLLNTPSLKRPFTESLVKAAKTRAFLVPVYIDFWSEIYNSCSVYVVLPRVSANQTWEGSTSTCYTLASEHPFCNNHGEADLAVIFWSRLFLPKFSVSVTCVDGDVFLLLYILACNLYDRGSVDYADVRKQRQKLYWVRPYSGGYIAYNMYAAMQALLEAEWTPLKVCVCSHLLKSDYIFKKYDFLDGVGSVTLVKFMKSVDCNKVQSILENDEGAMTFASAVQKKPKSKSKPKASEHDDCESSCKKKKETTPAIRREEVAQMRMDLCAIMHYYCTAFE